MTHGIRLCCLMLAAWAVLPLAGCGGVPVNSSSTTTTATTSPLAGNWLLYGSMPYQPPASSFTQGFAMDIQVTGTQILASARVQGSCSATSSFGITYSNILTGSIASDGTFSITSPSQSAIASIAVKGSVPSAAGASWPGTYTVTFTGLNGSCNVTQTGAFTASAVAQLTGTWSGSGSVYFSVGSGSVPVTISTTLQQGSPIYQNGVPASSTFGLGGSIKVQGISCFTSGAISTATPSLLEGNQATTFFTMNDGSTLQMFADIIDTGANTLEVSSLYVPTGTCAGLYSAVLTPLLLSR